MVQISKLCLNDSDWFFHRYPLIAWQLTDRDTNVKAPVLDRNCILKSIFWDFWSSFKRQLKINGVNQLITFYLFWNMSHSPLKSQPANHFHNFFLIFFQISTSVVVFEIFIPKFGTIIVKILKLFQFNFNYLLFQSTQAYSKEVRFFPAKKSDFFPPKICLFWMFVLRVREMYIFSRQNKPPLHPPK